MDSKEAIALIQISGGARAQIGSRFERVQLALLDIVELKGEADGAQLE